MGEGPLLQKACFSPQEPLYPQGRLKALSARVQDPELGPPYPSPKV